MRVSALTASLTNTLDEIIADGVGTALGLCPIKNLLMMKGAGIESMQGEEFKQIELKILL